MSWTSWEAEFSAANFKAIFPEWASTPTAIVESRIAMATPRTPSDVWGDLRPQGIAYLAAHLLAQLPGSKDMRLKDGTSVYGEERRRLETIVSSGWRVAGLPPWL